MSLKLLCLFLFFVCLLIQPAVNEVHTYNWTVKDAIINLDGFERPGFAVNGQVPGPTIRVPLGSVVIVNVHNALPQQPVTFHWHGIEQHGTPFMDGAHKVSQCPIPPASNFQYKFTVNQTGTYWWHSHTGLQYADGIHGALIVEDPNDPYKSDYDEEVLLIFGDWFHYLAETTATIGRHFPYRFVRPSSMVMNGKARFECDPSNPPEQFLQCKNNHSFTKFTLAANTSYRFRLINVGSEIDAGNFSIDGHSFSVIEADGVNMQKVDDITFLPMGIGQRYSIIVNTNQKIDNYWIRFSADAIDTPLDGKAILRYSGAPLKEPTTMHNVNGKVLNDIEQLSPLEQMKAIKPTRRITLNITLGDAPFWSINNIVWKCPSVPILQNAYDNNTDFGVAHVIPIAYNEHVEVVINNMFPVQHPMHMHGHSYQIIARGEGIFTSDDLLDTNVTHRNSNPLRRDTFYMEGLTWMVYRFVADNPGAWYLHCHIDRHIEDGLALVFLEAADQLPPPPSTFPRCGNFQWNNKKKK